MSIQNEFENYISNKSLFSKKDRLLLAVSGGVDSVVLCELCRHAGFDFIIAHCNFQLRGEESERDEKFVKQLGDKYGKVVLVKRFETEQYALQNKIGIQEAARELRYKWFYELVGSQESGVRSTPDSGLWTPEWILTAHHADDNIETLLMNFFKGTGIAGLRAMLPKQDKIVRPLLSFRKEELLKYAKEHQLTWVEDSSNASDKYSRNYFRKQIIPLIQKIYPQAEQNLLDNLNRFRDIEKLYQQGIEQHKKKLLEPKGNEVHIPVLKLKKMEPLPTLIFEIIKDFNFSSAQVPEVRSLIDSESGKYIQSSSHRIFKNRNWLIIVPLAAELAENILIEEGQVNLQLAMGNLQLSKFGITGNWLPIAIGTSTGNLTACFDAGEIKFPLLLRKWKAGDYFYPLGMKKKKKLARFFIDQKLSKTEKENVWVMEMNKKIIWVIGHRIDERVKVSDETREILKLSLRKN